MIEHNLQEVAEQFTVPEHEPPEVTMKVQRLMLVMNFGLHGVQPKIDYIHSTPLAAGKWVVFLNRAGTLAHVMHADDVEDGDYSRMKTRNLKDSHPNYIQRYFYNRMIKRYII